MRVRGRFRFFAVAVLSVSVPAFFPVRAQTPLGGLPTQSSVNFRETFAQTPDLARSSNTAPGRNPCSAVSAALPSPFITAAESRPGLLRASLDPGQYTLSFSFCGHSAPVAPFLPALPVPLSLPRASACNPAAALGMNSSCAPDLSFSTRRWLVLPDESAAGAILAARPRRERFHWGPALWQSFEFLLLEHTWRLAWDPYARYLVFHRPFWHDYLASAGHFDMSRWGDGDDFLVNYIGHPLEGSVTGNIFLQNDPQGRTAKFGRSRVYWKSRLKAMGWAAVYSAYFEIGPVLSEAALGNEGGYTYTPDCGFYPTCDKEPGKKYKPPTNNTGWVDFVVTPVIGTGWIVLEDAIEREIVDRLADGSPKLKYKILLGTLTPSRTMSNLLAGKRPWYRYRTKEAALDAFADPYSTLQRRLASGPDWMADPRWAMGLQFTSAGLPMDWEGCTACRVNVPGIGLTLGYRFSGLLSFDSEYNFFPGSGSEGKRGGAEEALAGLKFGRSFGSWGIFSQVRPGFIHYDKALVPGSAAQYQGATRFALDLSGGLEYHTSRHSAIRFSLGTTLIHYLAAKSDPNQPPVSVLSSDYYATQGSFHLTSGYVFRF